MQMYITLFHNTVIYEAIYSNWTFGLLFILDSHLNQTRIMIKISLLVFF